VTELTAGSGLLVPGLFDHYRAFRPRPAAYFGLPVTRRPDTRTVTVHGGGLVGSGPAGADRLPTPWAPAGLSLTALEGAGEVQTPLVGSTAPLLSVGDLVWFRHAKSGELFEHTGVVHLLAGDALVGDVATYRGHGLAF
jgi:D-serine deaminase-like pyridoxal phosphate-dependent protein